MARLIIFLTLTAFAVGFSLNSQPRDAECTVDNCDLANGCICLARESPLSVEETPQFVILTFDDSVQDLIYLNYYEPFLFNRVNPDGKPISATFFVPHEYTDYSRVNDLYNRGFEIADFSITKGTYWSPSDLEVLIQEFDGQKQIISKFANIPADHIKGARTPYLQINNNITFEAYVASGLTYDNSWPALSSNKLFPYTLDHKSSQPCLVGTCPSEEFPGFFVNPVNNLQGLEGQECNALLGCEVEGSAEEISSWLIQQFEKVYTTNRAPQTLMINSAWFQNVENSEEAYGIFLDYLGNKEGVFIVSHSEVQRWMLNPVGLSEYATNHEMRSAECNPVTCELSFGQQMRYMRSCVPCPAVFPWLGNPAGDEQY